MTTLTMRAAAGAAVLTAVALAGCSTQTVTRPTTTPASDVRAPARGSGAEVQQFLAAHDLDGMGAVEIIDELDRLGGTERPQDLMASVRPQELVLSAGDDELSLEIPDDLFYLSVAPYLDQTHECFNHSLTTCTGELASTEVQVQVVEQGSNDVLVEETRTTFENGFTGFWLPRDIEATLRITSNGKTAETDFTTHQDAPTCLTTMHLV